MGWIASKFVGLANAYNSSPALKIFWTVSSAILVIASAVLTIYFGYKTLYDSPTNIKAYYTVSEFPELLAYSGEIRNEDDSNADDFAFKAAFQSDVNGLVIKTPDVILESGGKAERGVVQFLLRRLSKGNQCEFDFFVTKENHMQGEMQISWKGGKGKLDLKEMDRNFKKGIELSERALSLNARTKWINSNTRDIGALK